MTEQEAQVWAAKMIRIWSVLAPFVIKVTHNGTDWHLTALVHHDVELRINTAFIPGGILCANSLLLTRATGYALREAGPNLAFLSCNDYEASETLLTNYWTVPPEDIRQRRNEWLPFFRRGCWLSGCPIEASAHEKAERMQDFSREEIDTWNLKF